MFDGFRKHCNGTKVFIAIVKLVKSIIILHDKSLFSGAHTTWQLHLGFAFPQTSISGNPHDLDMLSICSIHD